MVNWISLWIQGIVIAVIISTIIEMVLPNSNTKKYIRTVIGAYLIFVIISPIVVKITSKEIKLSSYELPEIKQQKIKEIDINTYVEATYINTIKQEIIKSIEEKGYKVSNIKIDIERKNEEYGNINKIELIISKKVANASSIEPINININSKTKKEDTFTKEEIQEIKKYLEEEYGVGHVLINE